MRVSEAPLISVIIPCYNQGRFLGEAIQSALDQSYVYRRSVLEIVKGFDTSRRACEDYDLYLRIAKRFPVLCQHGGNMSRDYGLMMRSSLSVLRSQREFVRGDEKLERDYRKGIRFWRDYCARGLIKQVKSCLELSEWRSALFGSPTLLRHYPQALTSRIALKMIRKIFRRVMLLSSRFDFMR